MDAAPPPADPQPALWARSRQAVVAEIVETALALFGERGYEATTMSQIAQQAGISQRSLFRYFGTKEDLVCGEQDALGELLVATVAAQPKSVPVWNALRTGFVAITWVNHTPERMLEIASLIFDNPALRARYHAKRLAWQEALVPVVEDRMGIRSGPIPDPRALGVIATVFACTDAAMQLWVRYDGKADLADLYDRALAAVRA